jgi:curved DNA-binding protein CbpA
MSSLQIKQGLSEFGYTDHYAILGLTVDTSSGDVRKRYLKIARFLHPDSCPPGMDKAFASQVLSKLVNPSYQTLSQEKERSEYSLLLKLVGQRANLELDLEKLKYPKAQELSSAPNFEELYQTTVQELAENQYNDLGELISHIEQLSELNLVFLLRRENPQFQSSSPGANAKTATASVKVATAPSPQPVAGNPPAFTTPSATQTSEDFVRQYIRRAEDLMSKNRFQEAVKELRDALKIDPSSSRCQTLMGRVYLKQKQLTMAKVHLTQALKLDPENLDATKAMAELHKLERAAGKTTQSQGKPVDQKRGGLFGLFGGKK